MQDFDFTQFDAQISPQFCPNFSLILHNITKFAQIKSIMLKKFSRIPSS